MKKFKFLFTKASLKSKILALIAVGLGVASILMVVSAASSTINGPLVEIPIIEMILPEEELDSIGEGIDEMFDEIEREPEAKDALEERFGLDIDELHDEMDINKVSLKSLDGLFQNVFGGDMAEEIGNSAEMESIKMIFSLIITIITAYAAAIAVFMGLSTLFLKKGLFVFAYMLALPFFIMFAGTASLIIATVLLIAYFVLVTIMNQEFKAWKYEQKMAKKALKAEAKAAKLAVAGDAPVVEEAPVEAEAEATEEATINE